MKTIPFLLTTAMILLITCTAIAQDGKYKTPPSKDVVPDNPPSSPLNFTAGQEKFLQRLAKRNNNPASMTGKYSFDINKIRRNPSLFRKLVLEHRKNLTPFSKLDAVANSQLESASVTGSGFHLTKDINALAESYPSNNNEDHETPPSFAVANNVIYFAADDGIHGSELWRSDGTAAGTYMVKDIEPGSAGSSPSYITAANGKVYFSAYTTADESKPWVSDGTASGTLVLFKTTFPPNPESSPHQFVSLGNTVYFVTGSTSSRSDHLWKTDGTQAGTVQIDSRFYISQLTAAGDHLFYTHKPDRLGFEIQLNSVDSNDNTTLLISNAGDPTQFTNYNNKLYFSMSDGTGHKLWVSNGTVAGTRPAPNNHNVIITPNDTYNAPPFPVADSVLYVTGIAANNTTALYKYDAYNKKELVKVKGFGAGDTIIQTEMAAVNNKLYFKVINNNGTPHNELWSSMGTAASTQLVQSFEPGDDIYNLYNGAGILYFVKKDTTAGAELWRVVNTAFGTSLKLVKDIFKGPTGSYPYFLTTFSGKLYFSATDGAKGNELFVTAGSTISTALVKNINTVATTSSNAGHDMIPFRNGVLFNAYDKVYGDELYKSDGTAGGTYLLNDVKQGELSSSPFSFLTKNNVAYFIANTSDSTNAIYKTDGTKKGLQKITPDYPKYPSYYETIKKFDVADNGIVYYAKVNNGGDQLWRSDGTATGTFMLYDNLYYDAALAVIGNTAFFVAYDAAHGAELWKSNGSVAGTRIVKDIYPGTGDARPVGFYVYKNELYFGADDGTDDGLWKSDGTRAGTVKLKSNIELFKDYDAFNSFKHFCISKDMLYFIATDHGNGYSVGLWKTNGNAAGTRLVKTLQPSAGSFEPNYLTDVNGTIFFINENSEYRMELWKSDGTTKGTTVVSDFTPYTASWYGLHNFISHAGKLYFTNDDVLWSSDGTKAGTTPVKDPVISKVQVYNLASAGSKLFASGNTHKYGTELYEATIDSTTAAITMTKVASAKAVNTTSFGAILYPNPASSVATLQLTGSTQNTTVTITNISGAQLWQRSNINATGINLPVGKLAAGTYIVTVTNGKESKTIKLVVSHR